MLLSSHHLSSFSANDVLCDSTLLYRGPLRENRIHICLFIGDASSSSSSEEDDETTGEDEVDMDNKGGTISKHVYSCMHYVHGRDHGKNTF